MKKLYLMLIIYVLVIAGLSSHSTNALDSVPPNSFSPESITINTSYEAVNDTASPGEPTIAAGKNAIVIMMNFKFAVYNKANPGVLKYTQDLSTWFGFSADWAVFDPHVIYDFDHDRFIMMATAKNATLKKSYWVLSVSTNTNPTINDWCKIRQEASETAGTYTGFDMDRPNISVDGQADILYLTGDIVSFDGVRQYSQIRMLDLSQTYACQQSNIQRYEIWNLTNDNGSKAITVQPARRLGTSGVSYFINTVEPASGSQLTLWTVQNNLTNAQPTGLTVGTNNYESAPATRQPGGTLLNPSSPRILQAQFANGYIWATHNVKNSAGTGTGIRTYKILPNGTGTIMPEREDANADFTYPSFVVDDRDSFVTVFNRSSPTEFISIRHAQFDASIQLKAGEGVYTAGNVWGDYAGAALDPNGVSYWFVHTYAKLNGQWGTWVGSTFPAKHIFLPLVVK